MGSSPTSWETRSGEQPLEAYFQHFPECVSMHVCFLSYHLMTVVTQT